MKRAELDFQRPQVLQAANPPEWRGLARDEVRLLVTTEHRVEHARFQDLPRFMVPGTLLVVNTSATIPASLPARHARLGSIVVNFSTRYGSGLWLAEPRWSATEQGPLPLDSGDRLDIAGIPVRLVASHPGLPRLWFMRVEGDLRAAMAREGMPVRYGYLEAPYPPLDAYQTIFARTPGSAEMPSAARPFSPRLLEKLQEKGIRFSGILLHTGVSSHEIEADVVEAQVLYAEPFVVSASTAEAVNTARAEGHPVIAVGTTVIRALESAWDGERVRPASGFTRLFVHPERSVRSVDGLLTGLHDPVTSHLAMLYAVASEKHVRTAYDEAIREGYHWHEFGDSHLLLPRAA